VAAAELSRVLHLEPSIACDVRGARSCSSSTLIQPRGCSVRRSRHDRAAARSAEIAVRRATACARNSRHCTFFLGQRSALRLQTRRPASVGRSKIARPSPLTAFCKGCRRRYDGTILILTLMDRIERRFGNRQSRYRRAPSAAWRSRWPPNRPSASRRSSGGQRREQRISQVAEMRTAGIATSRREGPGAAAT